MGACVFTITSWQCWMVSLAGSCFCLMSAFSLLTMFTTAFSSSFTSRGLCGMCACGYVCVCVCVFAYVCVCVCVVCVVELHWEDVYKQSPHIIQEHHAYLLRVHRKMILPWFCGSGMPAQVVTAYCVAVSWARHLTAYWSPCSHKM